VRGIAGDEHAARAVGIGAFGDGLQIATSSISTAMSGTPIAERTNAMQRSGRDIAGDVLGARQRQVARAC
jgi:hypothetical protein